MIRLFSITDNSLIHIIYNLISQAAVNIKLKKANFKSETGAANRYVW